MMPRVLLRTGLSLVALGLLGAAAILALDSRATLAGQAEVTWAIAGRSASTEFFPGHEPPPPGEQGFEIVAAGVEGGLVGPSGNVDAYQYAASAGPETPRFVRCHAELSASLQAIVLLVDGGYPFAGCVYYLAVRNSGPLPIDLDLGQLDDGSGVFCNGPDCKVDLLAGGSTAGRLAATCQFSGAAPPPAPGSLVISLQPGAEAVCPLFVVVLQAAAENTTYRVAIRAPRPEPGDGAVAPLQPFPPAAGSGLVVQAEPPPSRVAPVAAALLLGAFGLLLVVLGRRRRADPAENPPGSPASPGPG